MRSLLVINKCSDGTICMYVFFESTIVVKSELIMAWPTNPLKFSLQKIDLFLKFSLQKIYSYMIDLFCFKNIKITTIQQGSSTVSNITQPKLQ